MESELKIISNISVISKKTWNFRIKWGLEYLESVKKTSKKEKKSSATFHYFPPFPISGWRSLFVWRSERSTKISIRSCPGNFWTNIFARSREKIGSLKLFIYALIGRFLTRQSLLSNNGKILARRRQKRTKSETSDKLLVAYHSLFISPLLAMFKSFAKKFKKTRKKAQMKNTAYFITNIRTQW